MHCCGPCRKPSVSAKCCEARLLVVRWHSEILLDACLMKYINECESLPLLFLSSMQPSCTPESQPACALAPHYDNCKYYQSTSRALVKVLWNFIVHWCIREGSSQILPLWECIDTSGLRCILAAARHHGPQSTAIKFMYRYLPNG